MATNMSVLLALVTCLSLARMSHGYSSGAPNGACDSMVPSHGVPPQNTASPYQVTVSKTAVMPGEQIEVSISGTGNEKFKGFLLQGRQGNQIVGQFLPNSQGSSRCSNQGMTHTDPTDKDMVKFTWTVPGDLNPGTFKFVATVVRLRTAFWTFVSSPDLTVSASQGTTGTTGGTAMTPAGMNTTPRNTGGNTNGNSDDDDDGNDDDAGIALKVGPGWMMVILVSFLFYFYK